MSIFFVDIKLKQNAVPIPSSYDNSRDDPISGYHIKIPYLTIKEKTVRYFTNAVYWLGGHEYCQGIFRGEKIAIKKYHKTSRNLEGRILELLNHPNVIKSYLQLNR